MVFSHGYFVELQADLQAQEKNVKVTDDVYLPDTCFILDENQAQILKLLTLFSSSHRIYKRLTEVLM